MSRSLIPFHTGVSPSGKARDFDSLIRWFESSHPCHAFSDAPILLHMCHAPLAQSVEHLPFKQGVRGSNPRRGTKKKDTRKRVFLFVFDVFSGMLESNL